jgi:TonB family protein
LRGDGRRVTLTGMNFFARAVRAALVTVTGLSLGTSLFGQHLLYTEHDGKMVLVRGARESRPYIEIEGKRVLARGDSFLLSKAEEYLPAVVFIKNLKVGSVAETNDGGFTKINNTFQYKAELESRVDLEGVFAVFKLDTKDRGKAVFIHEIGDLKANETKEIFVTAPVTGPLGKGRYELYLFAGVEELLHTKMAPEYRDEVIDHLTAHRIEGVQDAPPQPLMGAAARYPEALLGRRPSGRAVIALRIGTNGRVYDLAVKSATDPAFGEEALAAMRLVRFLPRVKNGHAVETRAEIPIDFTPPSERHGRRS